MAEQIGLRSVLSSVWSDVPPVEPVGSKIFGPGPDLFSIFEPGPD